MIHSYPSICNLGHKALTELFSDDVIVEEKVDGSQFSFGKLNGELVCRSKGRQIEVHAPDNMFRAAVNIAAEKLERLPEGVVFRGEYLQKPKHNTLAYNRIPNQNVIIFDIDRGGQDYILPEEKKEWAGEMGFEVVPCFFHGKINDVETLKAFMERESCLGGPKIEGFVIKNYHRFGPDKKVLMGKHVSEAFKETHKKEWKETNPKSGDIIIQLKEIYKTEARWKKAVQHLADDGKLKFEPQDLGMLISEVASDIKADSEEEIKQMLFNWAWPQLRRTVTGGFPEWYKNFLMERQFGEKD